MSGLGQADDACSPDSAIPASESWLSSSDQSACSGKPLEDALTATESDPTKESDDFTDLHDVVDARKGVQILLANLANTLARMNRNITAFPKLNGLPPQISITHYDSKRVRVDQGTQTAEESGMYKSYLTQSAEHSARLERENLELKRQIVDIDEKINDVLTENRYLRWENEQLEQNNNCVRRNLDAKMGKVAELEEEIRILKHNQEEINQVYKLKQLSQQRMAKKELDRQVDLARQTLSDRLNEEIQIRKGYQEDVRNLKRQLDSVKGVPTVITKLLEDNKSLYSKLAELKMQKKLSKDKMTRSSTEAMLDDLATAQKLEHEQRLQLTDIVIQISQDVKRLMRETLEETDIDEV